MIPLVSIEFAMKDRNAYSRDQALVAGKLNQATSIVMNHCKLTAFPDSWIVRDENGSPPINEEFNPEDLDIVNDGGSPPVFYRIPGNVQAACLLILGELFENREGGNKVSEILNNGLLDGFRDPTFA